MTKVVAETGGGFAVSAILTEMVAHSVRHHDLQVLQAARNEQEAKEPGCVNSFTEADRERKLRRYMGIYFSNQ